MDYDPTETCLDKKSTVVSIVTPAHPPMDTLSGWVACVCSSLAGLISNGMAYTYGLFFPSLLEEFKAGKAKTAAAGSLAFGLICFLCPVSAKLCKRFGSRVVMVCGGITCALGILISSFSPSLYLLYFSHGFVVGFGASMVYMASFDIVPLYFDKHRSLATSMVSGGAAAGLIIMSPIVAELSIHFDWRKSFLVLAGINLLPSILGFSITRKNNANYKEVKEEMQSRRKLDAPLYKDPMFVLIAFFVVIAFVGHYIPIVHLAKYSEDLGVSAQRSSWMYLAIGSSSLITRVLTGKLCDARWISNIRIFQFGVVTFAVADFLVPLAKSFTALISYSIAFGICEGIYTTPIYCLILDLYSSEGLGWFISFFVIPQGLAPVLAGFIADTTGSYHPAFFSAGGILIFAACLSLVVPFLETPEKAKNLGREEIFIFERETVC